MDLDELKIDLFDKYTCSSSVSLNLFRNENKDKKIQIPGFIIEHNFRARYRINQKTLASVRSEIKIDEMY